MYSRLLRVVPKVASVNTVSQRGVATIGKHFAEARRQSMAVKAAATAERLAAQAKLPKAAPVEIAPEVIEARKRTKYVTMCDTKNPVTAAAALDIAAEATDVTFANREFSQMIQMAAAHGLHKQCLKIFQKIIDADYVPERNAFRGALLCLERAEQWKTANIMFAFLKDVHPVIVYDEVGMVTPAVVLQNPIPDFTAFIETPASENNLVELEKFYNTRSAHGRPARYNTIHKLIKELVRVGRGEEATKMAFAMFHRIRCAETDEVPAPFSPIFVHHVYTGGNQEYKTDFPSMYTLVSYLESIGNYSAAMQIHIYLRSLNRNIDITPIREVTTGGKTRDFVDLHTYTHQKVGYVINQWLKELRLRRGYAKAVEAKVEGVEGAVTYMRPTALTAALVDSSSLLNTEIQPLVILADRSYNHVDVRTEKAPEALTANFIVARFAKVGITAQISKASELSSSYDTLYCLDKAPELLDDVHRELIVIVSPEELSKYAEREIAKNNKA